MSTNDTEVFFRIFDDLEDPRIDWTKLYPLIEILFVIVCGIKSAKKKFKEMSIRRPRKKTGWDDATLDLILQANF